MRARGVVLLMAHLVDGLVDFALQAGRHRRARRRGARRIRGGLGEHVDVDVVGTEARHDRGRFDLGFVTDRTDLDLVVSGFDGGEGCGSAGLRRGGEVDPAEVGRKFYDGVTLKRSTAIFADADYDGDGHFGREASARGVGARSDGVRNVGPGLGGRGVPGTGGQGEQKYHAEQPVANTLACLVDHFGVPTQPPSTLFDCKR